MAVNSAKNTSKRSTVVMELKQGMKYKVPSKVRPLFFFPSDAVFCTLEKVVAMKQVLFVTIYFLR